VTRKARTRIARRLVTALALAALVVPATAQARPLGAGIPNVSTPVEKINLSMHRNGQLASPAFIPSAPVHTTTIKADSSSKGFDWTDALIGSGVTAGLAALAMAGAVAVRRQRRFGYR
jgi:hypothetical protein